MPSKRRRSAVLLLVFFLATIKRVNSDQKQKTLRQQTNPTTKVDGNNLAVDENKPAVDENKDVGDDSTIAKPTDKKRVRGLEILQLHVEKLKKINHGESPHGQNQKTLAMYKLRGGGDAVTAILKAVETENQMHLSQDAGSAITPNDIKSQCTPPKNPEGSPSCCACNDATPVCPGDLVPQHSGEIPCTCNPNGGFVCVPPADGQKGKSDDTEQQKSSTGTAANEGAGAGV